MIVINEKTGESVEIKKGRKKMYRIIRKDGADIEKNTWRATRRWLDRHGFKKVDKDSLPYEEQKKLEQQKEVEELLRPPQKGVSILGKNNK